MRITGKSFAKLAVCAMTMTTLAGAVVASAKETTTAAKETTEAAAEAVAVDLEGTITMAGSTSMEKLCSALAEDYMNKNDKVTVTAEFIGSGAGIEAVTAGTVDIGNSSRALKDSELENGVVENIVAIDGIAVVVDNANEVEDLSQEDLAAIYTGEITNWSEVGGSNTPIVVVGRESGSGTRGAFEELLDIADKCAYANELDNTGAVMAKIASTPGAIGYVSLDVLDNSVQVVKIDGVEATVENIQAGDYALSRPFVMATMGEITEQSDLVQNFFSYVTGEDGQAIIEAVGLIVPSDDSEVEEDMTEEETTEEVETTKAK